jgi:hypothetical protein
MRASVNLVTVVLTISVVACGSSHHSSGGGVAPMNTSPNTGATTTDPHIQNALDQINASRAQNGSPALALDASLDSCGLQHAEDCASCAGDNIAGFTNCAHGDFKSGNTCGASAENQGVATGVTSSNEDQAFDSIHEAMMAEGPPPPGQDNHFLNIVNPSYTTVGIGLFVDQNGNLWLSEEFH